MKGYRPRIWLSSLVERAVFGGIVLSTDTVTISGL